jgi:DNA-binding NtrC family response regulator
MEGSLDDVVDFADYQPAGSFERQIRDYKIKLAVNAVRENNGNKTLAARSLCISRAYLHRLIRLAGPEALAGQENNSVSGPQGFRESAMG